MNQISPWPRPGNCKEIIEYSEVPFPFTGSLLIDDNENIFNELQSSCLWIYQVSKSYFFFIILWSKIYHQLTWPFRRTRPVSSKTLCKYLGVLSPYVFIGEETSGPPNSPRSPTPQCPPPLRGFNFGKFWKFLKKMLQFENLVALLNFNPRTCVSSRTTSFQNAVTSHPRLSLWWLLVILLE